MGRLPEEIRLAATIAVSGFVLIAGYRFARRFGCGDAVAAIVDALLVFYLVQYLAVGVPGLLGILNPISMIACAMAIGMALWFAAGRQLAPIPPLTPQPDNAALLACFVVVASMLISLVWDQRFLPPMANDALTYHLPAAVQWLQSRRLGLYETWLYNPANTYSPLAGSMFMAWLIGPIGHDVLARFVQVPAMLLIFFAMIRVAEATGAGRIVAAMIAAAAVLSRPIISQSVLAKDDLFLAAFFVATVAGMSRQALVDRLGPWRIGAAIGLMLATKYTALFSLPLLALLIDAPIRAGWRKRQWVVATLVTVVLAGPWYLRNIIVTGNPVFPIDLPMLGGLFGTARSERLGTLGGIWHALALGYYSLPPAPLIVVAVAWFAAMLLSARRILREPLVRVCLIGPLVGFALVVTLSPYDELRFIYPSLLMLFASVGLLGRVGPAVQIVAAVIVLVLSLATSFVPPVLMHLLPAAVAAAIALLGIVAISGAIRDRMTQIALASMAIFAIAAWVFVFWPSGLARYQVDGHNIWSHERLGYGGLGEAWRFVREQLPRGATLAYANTFFVYPLYGFDLDRTVVYAPLRPELKSLHDLPPINTPLSGERIVSTVAAATIEQPDRDAWIANLRAAGAKYLFVAKADLTGSRHATIPPELQFAQQEPARFVRVFDNDAAAVFDIRWDARDH